MNLIIQKLNMLKEDIETKEMQAKISGYLSYDTDNEIKEKIYKILEKLDTTIMPKQESELMRNRTCIPDNFWG